TNNPHHNAALFGDAVEFGNDRLPLLLRPIVKRSVVGAQIVVRRRRDSQVDALGIKPAHDFQAVAIVQSAISYPLHALPWAVLPAMRIAAQPLGLYGLVIGIVGVFLG